MSLSSLTFAMVRGLVVSFVVPGSLTSPHCVNFVAVMSLPTAVQGEADLRKRHAGRMIIAALDVAQYLSGIGLKLQAYEQFLNDSPSWREQVVLVQRCVIPGNRELDETRTIEATRSIVERIKARFGEGVIDYDEVYGSALPVDQRMALWTAADCLLNTEVRAGFNHWPLEFVYAQKESASPGIVVASEYSDVGLMLNGALRINPFDVKCTVTTIDRALSMGKEEREGRHLRDIGFVSSASSSVWIQNVLRDLEEACHWHGKAEEQIPSESAEGKNVAEFLSSECDEQFTPLNPRSILSAYQSTSRRVIVLDFNGTIVMKEAVDRFLKQDDIGSTGDAPPDAVCQSLVTLCADPNNTVFVVSGDNNANLERAIGHIPGLGLAASNGSCFSPPPRKGEPRTWLALDLGVDWESVKTVS